mmetsp:Transcript_38633/g.92802  ORF Transcript_38633/g.92802 Transcript_38633/m.92802 type:complete len:221 (-) Transcript_38633:625-1287(-)
MLAMLLQCGDQSSDSITLHRFSLSLKIVCPQGPQHHDNDVHQTVIVHMLLQVAHDDRDCLTHDEVPYHGVSAFRQCTQSPSHIHLDSRRERLCSQRLQQHNVSVGKQERVLDGRLPVNHHPDYLTTVILYTRLRGKALQGRHDQLCAASVDDLLGNASSAVSEDKQQPHRSQLGPSILRVRRHGLQARRCRTAFEDQLLEIATPVTELPQQRHARSQRIR